MVGCTLHDSSIIGLRTLIQLLITYLIVVKYWLKFFIKKYNESIVCESDGSFACKTIAYTNLIFA